MFISSILLIYGHYLKRKLTQFTLDDWYDLHREKHNKLIQLLISLLSLLNKYKITHFISDGALLGLARNGRMIPYDDDIDLVIYCKSDPITFMKKLKHILKANDIKVRDAIFQKFGLQVYDKDNWLNFIDLFIYVDKDDNNDRIECIYKHDKKLAPDHYKSETFPVIYKKFENISVPIPKHYDKFLSRYYSPDYMKNYKITKLHPGHFNIFQILSLHTAGFFPHTIKCNNK